MTSTSEAVTIPVNLTMHHPDCHCAPCDARREGTVPAPFEAFRLVELDPSPRRADQRCVQVDLTPLALREVVSMLGRAIVTGRIPTHRLFAAGATGVDGIRAAQWVASQITAPSWHLSDEDAQALALALSEAAEEPPACARCAGWVDIDGAYCSGCDR